MKKTSVKIMTLVSVCMISAAMLMTGCGSSSGKSSYASEALDKLAYYEASEAADFYDYDYAAEEAMVESSANGASESSVEVNDTSRKLIKNVDLDVQTNDLEELVTNVTNRINSYAGYIESSYVYNGSGSYKNNRSASITARIPAKHLDEFLDNVAEVSNITSKSIDVSDVTLQYVDVEARRSSLKTQYERLLELMEQAETVEDIIVIEDRLAQIRYELESAERQIRTYDNQVDYSTVRMEISEVKEYTPVEEPGRFEKMTNGFLDSIKSIVEGFLDFIVGLVVAIPYLILWAVIIFIIVVIVKAIIKACKKHETMKQAKLQAKLQAKYQAELVAKMSNDANADDTNASENVDNK